MLIINSNLCNMTDLTRNTEIIRNEWNVSDIKFRYDIESGILYPCLFDLVTILKWSCEGHINIFKYEPAFFITYACSWYWGVSKTLHTTARVTSVIVFLKMSILYLVVCYFFLDFILILFSFPSFVSNWLHEKTYVQTLYCTSDT